MCVHRGTHHLEYSSKREWEAPDSSGLRGWCLARRPVVAQAQFGPGDGHLVPTRGAHVRGEMDDAAVVLYVLKFVLLGRLHVDH